METKDGVTMMELTPELVKMVTANPSITLPKFLWLIITTRAVALFDGNIDECCQDIFEAGLNQNIKLLGMGPTKEEALKDAATPPTPNQNCPGGSA